MWGVGVTVSVYSHTHTQKPGALLLALGEDLACHSRQELPQLAKSSLITDSPKERRPLPGGLNGHTVFG